MSSLRLGLVQMLCGADKARNVAHAVAKVKEAASKGAELVVLPECFNSPYGTQYFADYAEPIPGQTTEALCAAAAEAKVDLIGGSIPERGADGKLYNASPIISAAGRLLGVFRKLHLFDIDVPGGIRFQESEVLTAGSEPVIFKTSKGVSVGLGICYDVRFAPLAQLYAQAGCSVLLYPGAFNMTTGPVHWEALGRARALDNQCFVGLCSPARDEKASYVAYGHSLLLDPWGKAVASAKESEETLICDLDLDYVRKVRMMVPISHQRRDDLYGLTVPKPPTVLQG